MAATAYPYAVDPQRMTIPPRSFVASEAPVVADAAPAVAKPRRVGRVLLLLMVGLLAVGGGIWATRPSGRPYVITNETYAVAEAAPTTVPPTTAPKPTTTVKAAPKAPAKPVAAPPTTTKPKAPKAK